MDIYLILGYTGAFIIGVLLGLIGGGGSILAVPILAYLFFINEKLATAYSLFIVGVSALFGGLSQHKKGYVNWKIALVFGLPALVGVTLMRTYIVPNIPDVIYSTSSITITRRMLMFGLFAVLMFLAAISMLRKQKETLNSSFKSQNYYLITIEGVVVGSITGLVGAGGGFLIIPALMFLAKMEIKKAIGTSLIIIAFKSIFGFLLGDALIMEIDWFFLLRFTTIALLGIAFGTYLGNFINSDKLKKVFGYFIFCMSLFILYMEFFMPV